MGNTGVYASNAKLLSTLKFPFNRENGEMNFTRDEIKQWKIDGWTFRKKTVKGHHYITRRKGKKEKSLGRYSDNLWKLIEGTTIEPSPIEKRGNAERVISEIIRQNRSFQMSETCTHIIEGFCHFWKYSDRPGFFNLSDNGIGKGYYQLHVTTPNQVHWVYKATPFYCLNCPAFVRK